MFPVITFKIKVLVLKAIQQTISHRNKIEKLNALSAKTDTTTVLRNLRIWVWNVTKSFEKEELN